MSGSLELPFTASVRDLEIALAKERAYSRQLYDYVGRITKVYQELQKNELNLRNQIASGRSRDAGIESSNRKLQADLEEIRTELSRYRRAWSDILLREREAESIIAESTRIRARIEELEAENRGLYQQQSTEQAKIESERRRIEDHYRTELQNTLFRLHGAEAKFNNIAQEMQALEQKLEVEGKEAQKREDALRWEMQNKILDERERVKKIFDETTKKSQMDFERETDTIRSEFARALAEEKRAAAEGLEKALAQKDAHINELQSRIGEVTETRKLEIETLTANHSATVKKLTEDRDGQIKRLTDSRDAEMKRLAEARALEVKNLTESHTTHLEELTQAHAASIQDLAQYQDAELRKVTVTRDLELAQLRESSSAELSHLRTTSATALRAADIFGKQILGEKNAASEELNRIRSLLQLKEEEIKNARDLAEKRKLTILELEFGHSETIALLESTASSRISELEMKTSEIITDVKADAAQRITAAETGAMQKVAAAEALAADKVAALQAETETQISASEAFAAADIRQAALVAEARVRETQEAASVQLRQTQEMGQARIRELEAHSADELRERDQLLQTVRQELRAAQDILAVERATIEERIQDERQNVALEQAETAHVREELAHLQEDASQAAAKAQAEKTALLQQIETQEKDFQLLCDTLVQAQKAAASAEGIAEAEKDAAIEALAYAEGKDLRTAALADECELLRKVLEAERQKMREIVLQLKFELKRRKTGVELSPQVLDTILAGADAADLKTRPADPSGNN